MASSAEGTAEVGDSRSERQSAERSSSGSAQRFLELLPQWLALMPLSFKTVWKASVVVLSRYRFKRSSNFMPRASTLLAQADVRVGFPSTLMRVVALMAFFCSIHSFLYSCEDRMVRFDRYLTSEGCNTLSMAKTLGKAHVLSIRIQSHIVFLYIIIVPTFNVTHSNFYVVEATHFSEFSGFIVIAKVSTS